MHVGLVTRSQVDYALDLANDLSGAGLFVSLYMSHEFTARETGTADRTVERLYEVGLLPRMCAVRLLRLPRMRNPRSFVLFHELSRTMCNDGVELAHILLNPGEVWFAALACLLHTMPVVSTMIVPQPNIGERVPPFVFWAINKLATLGSDAIVVNGVDQVELVQGLYGIPLNRVSHVPLSVRTTAVRWAEESVLEEPGTILFFGRARPSKGLEYLIRAQPIITRQNPSARILIAAHGEELQRYRQMIQDDSRFEIHDGFVPGDVMATLFQRSSVVVLPYLSASTSGVLMTAYSFGKPVVTTRVGSLMEYVEDGGTGLLVAPADVDELAEAVIRLLENDTLRHNMGDAAARWVEEKQKKITAQTLKVYEKAVQLHNSGLRHRARGIRSLGTAWRRTRR